jgi:hypothetical protein
VVGWHDDPFSDVDAELLLYRDDVIDEEVDEDDEDDEELEAEETILS